MFIKVSNHHKKITHHTRNSGYRQYTPPRADSFFTHFLRYENGIISEIAVSDRKRNPMVKITHRFPDGERFFIQKVLLNKSIWVELVELSNPAMALKTIIKDEGK